MAEPGSLVAAEGDPKIGDVPTWTTTDGPDGHAEWTAGGGGGASTVKVIRFPFTHSTAGLAAGVVFYSAQAGEYLSIAAIEVDTAFNGTTPKADIGWLPDFASTNGIFNLLSGVAAPLDTAWSNGPDLPGTGAGIAPINAQVLQPYGFTFTATQSLPIKFTAPINLVVWASQDGMQGSTPIGGSAGAGAVVAQIWTPA